LSPCRPYLAKKTQGLKPDLCWASNGSCPDTKPQHGGDFRKAWIWPPTLKFRNSSNLQ
jgi:hypothetical protein